VHAGGWASGSNRGFSSTIYSNNEPILLQLIKHTKMVLFSECLLRLGVLCVFVMFCVFVLYGPFCHGGLKLDTSILLTTIFLWQSLQFIFKFIDILHYDLVCDCIWGQSIKGHGHRSLLLTRLSQ